MIANPFPALGSDILCTIFSKIQDPLTWFSTRSTCHDFAVFSKISIRVDLAAQVVFLAPEIYDTLRSVEVKESPDVVSKLLLAKPLSVRTLPQNISAAPSVRIAQLIAAKQLKNEALEKDIENSLTQQAHRIIENPSLWEYGSSEIRNNVHLALYLITSGSDTRSNIRPKTNSMSICFPLLGDMPKNDFNFALEVLKQTPYNLTLLGQNLQNDPSFIFCALHFLSKKRLKMPSGKGSFQSIYLASQYAALFVAAGIIPRRDKQIQSQFIRLIMNEADPTNHRIPSFFRELGEEQSLAFLQPIVSQPINALVLLQNIIARTPKRGYFEELLFLKALEGLQKVFHKSKYLEFAVD